FDTAEGLKDVESGIRGRKRAAIGNGKSSRARDSRQNDRSLKDDLLEFAETLGSGSLAQEKQRETKTKVYYSTGWRMVSFWGRSKGVVRARHQMGKG
ncbi:hypothetical protein B296_00036831, partial [Ensete ventricosum]